jgi:hypothetical protein
MFKPACPSQWLDSVYCNAPETQTHFTFETFFRETSKLLALRNPKGSSIDASGVSGAWSSDERGENSPDDDLASEIGQFRATITRSSVSGSASDQAAGHRDSFRTQCQERRQQTWAETAAGISVSHQAADTENTVVGEIVVQIVGREIQILGRVGGNS